MSLFAPNVAIYAVPNNGGWYDFGYFLGIVVFGVGARKSHIVYTRPRHRRPRAEDRLMRAVSREPRSGSAMFSHEGTKDDQARSEPTALAFASLRAFA